MTAAELAKLVRGARRSGSGYTAHCPAHDDRRPSLSFRDGKRGVLVTCHAGCLVERITMTLGLRVGNLFSDGETPKSGSSHPARRVVEIYQYLDEAGALLFEVVRYDAKSFRQRRPDGRGGRI